MFSNPSCLQNRSSYPYPPFYKEEHSYLKTTAGVLLIGLIAAALGGVGSFFIARKYGWLTSRIRKVAIPGSAGCLSGGIGGGITWLVIEWLRLNNPIERISLQRHHREIDRLTHRIEGTLKRKRGFLRTLSEEDRAEVNQQIEVLERMKGSLQQGYQPIIMESERVGNRSLPLLHNEEYRNPSSLTPPIGAPAVIGASPPLVQGRGESLDFSPTPPNYSSSDYPLLIRVRGRRMSIGSPSAALHGRGGPLGVCSLSPIRSPTLPILSPSAIPRAIPQQGRGVSCSFPSPISSTPSGGYRPSIKEGNHEDSFFVQYPSVASQERSERSDPFSPSPSMRMHNRNSHQQPSSDPCQDRSSTSSGDSSASCSIISLPPPPSFGVSEGSSTSYDRSPTLPGTNPLTYRSPL